MLENGTFKKNMYKRFKIKEMYNQDDPKCMAQVLERRLNKAINEKNKSFLPLPNVILLDGGITQINAVKEVLQGYSLDIPLFGMVKDDKHRTRAILNSDNVEISLNTNVVKNFVTNIQDEIHNYTIAYHRNLRDSKVTKSILDNIQGIGKKRKQELLKKFGSIENILKSDTKELMEINGITEQIAKDVLNYLKNDSK